MIRISQTGAGVFAQRLYGDWIDTERQLTRTDFTPLSRVEIQNITAGGQSVHYIGIDDNLIESLNLVTNQRGSATGKLVLNALPTFEIEIYSLIKIFLKQNEAPIWTGYVSVSEEQSAGRLRYIFNLFGLQKDLESIEVPAFFNGIDPSTDPRYNYGSNYRITDLISALAEHLLPQTERIIYDARLIESNTRILPTPLNIEGKTAIEIFDLLATASGLRWGIDDQNRFFVRSYEAEPDQVFYEGWHGEKASLKRSFNSVKNVWFISKENDEQEEVLAGVYTDPVSIKKYGRRKGTYKVAANFPDTTIQALGQILLADNREPQPFLNIQNIDLTNTSIFFDVTKTVVNTYAR